MIHPTIKDINKAYHRIKPFVHKTPVLTCKNINDRCGAHLSFKCENFQKAGAFKIRGASNALLSLEKGELANGVATHSSGNHAAALALAAKWNHTRAFIVMPINSARCKKEAVAGYGAEITYCQPTLDSR
jgi:threonine dehydratase